MSNYYTVYDNRTEEIIVSGNATQCAEALGIKQSSFYYQISRQRRDAAKHKYSIVVDSSNNSKEEK